MMQRQTIIGYKLTHWLHTTALLAALLALSALIGLAFAGTQGVVWALLLGGLLLLFGRQMPTPLAMRMLRARPIAAQQMPDLVQLVALLAQRAGLARVPTVYLVPSHVPNAFATGTRGDAALGVTFGLLNTLPPRELAGVLAHEISHIRANDLRVMALANVISRVTGILAGAGQLLLLINLPFLLFGQTLFSWWAILLLLTAPTISGLLQLALSRTREFNADLGAVQLTGDPYGLASALDRLERRQGGWFGRLFGGNPIGVPAALRSHPHTQERIARLLTLLPPTHANGAPPRVSTPLYTL